MFSGLLKNPHFPALPLFFLLVFSALVSADDAYSLARKRMIDQDIKGRGVKNPMVLEVMGAVPRHLFVDDSYWDRAYEDHPLPVGEGQTISQPYVVALTTEALRLRSKDRVLEIGTGSGYQAAVLGRIVKEVLTNRTRDYQPIPSFFKRLCAYS